MAVNTRLNPVAGWAEKLGTVLSDIRREFPFDLEEFVFASDHPEVSRARAERRKAKVPAEPKQGAKWQRGHLQAYQGQGLAWPAEITDPEVHRVVACLNTILLARSFWRPVSGATWPTVRSRCDYVRPFPMVCTLVVCLPWVGWYRS